MMNKILFSSKKEDWETPQDFYDILNDEFHFNLDPCSNQFNHKCDNYFTIEDDGLKQSWGGQRVFCNPPYGKKIYEWVKKASKESKKEKTLIVMLLPSRTDTKYFHEFLYNKPNVELRFIKGRLKFGGSKNSAPFPSLIAIFKEVK